MDEKKGRNTKAENLPRVMELFLHQNKTGREIAAILRIPKSTVYKWIKDNEAVAKREEIANTAWQVAQEIRSVLPEVIKRLKQDPSPGNADAAKKVISSLKAIEKEADIVGFALIVMKKLTLYLRKVDPKATEIINDHIEGFIAELRKDNA